ncbi:hypothetical protein T458_01745 [Brevibacillus panacihumi W25]|uniref:Uncharacterized protein n=1 Tax=Brevibacillus panacihumi W25 TaxID=1408254 RepID=V6MDZ2_9BACL|nr:hypothetical protein T458_01745 [Brevibacillus panacihumi W25]
MTFLLLGKLSKKRNKAILPYSLVKNKNEFLRMHIWQRMKKEKNPHRENVDFFM